MKEDFLLDATRIGVAHVVVHFGVENPRAVDHPRQAVRRHAQEGRDAREQEHGRDGKLNDVRDARQRGFFVHERTFERARLVGNPHGGAAPSAHAQRFGAVVCAAVPMSVESGAIVAMGAPVASASDGSTGNIDAESTVSMVALVGPLPRLRDPRDK